MKIFGSVLVFFAELGMLAALGWWGFVAFDGGLRWIVGIGLPLAVATVWGVFLAPKASRPLARGPQVVVRLVLLVGGAAAFWAAGSAPLAAAQAGCAVIGTLLADVLARESDVAPR